MKAEQQSAAEMSAGAARGMDKGEYAELAKAQWGKLKKEFETRKRSKDPFGVVMDPATVKEKQLGSIADIVETKE
ncbi:MAG: hypothetical protein L3J79_07565, partial [Candidatus Marinimicrobia bacterium]|nr:hypothetical protein [Candidatus Neomarinimicrobiota bacterium]